MPGRKIICESCKTIFKEDLLGDATVCPVCGQSLIDDMDGNNIEETQSGLSFGDEFILGEDDSFDEDKIDFWWYEIDEDKDGDSNITCTTCGAHSFTDYPIARCGDYVLIDSSSHARCSKCRKKLKNHILSKRPENYVDPRPRDMFITYDKVPRCPVCSSSQIHKISATNKVASAVTFGLFVAGHISKTFKCDTCGAKF